ncbi:hypothetical protein V8F33_005453 [Rhypophila sp. PSN 637]
MASLPPDTIKVKRKRGVEEGPVDFLRVDGHKRHRSVSGQAVWVYQRKQPSSDLYKNDRAPGLPVIRATEEGDENRPVKALRQKVSRASTTTEAGVNESKPTNEPASGVAETPSPEQMRRFHLSIPDSLRLPGVASKKRGAPAVFVERTPKKLKNLQGASTPSPVDTPVDRAQSPEPAASQDEPDDGPVRKEPVKNKRPGMRARTTKHTQELPKSLVERHAGVDQIKLARDMDAFALSQIKQTIARMEKEDAKTEARRNKYKPKAPVKRYAERHPEEHAAELERAKAAAHNADVMDTTLDDTSDDDYVTETYERVPASRLRDGAVPASRVGLLVFDTEQVMDEFFYGEEGDSDDEFPEDEDDENAENHYTADYPDEDMPWDDAFDRNPYRYLNHNAEDRELGLEIDEEDDEDDDDDKLTDGYWEQTGAYNGLDERDIYY